MLKLLSRVFQKEHVPVLKSLGETHERVNYVLAPFVSSLATCDEPKHVDLVWVFIDPFPNGVPGELIIMSGTKIENVFVVLKIDHIWDMGENHNFHIGCELIRDHFGKLMDQYANVKFGLIMEASGYDEAPRIYTEDVLRYFDSIKQPHRVYVEKHIPRSVAYGILTTEPMRMLMVSSMQIALKHGEVNLSNAIDAKIRKDIIHQLKLVFVSPYMQSPGPSRIQSNARKEFAVTLMRLLYHQQKTIELNDEFDEWIKIY